MRVAFFFFLPSNRRTKDLDLILLIKSNEVTDNSDQVSFEFEVIIVCFGAVLDASLESTFE